MPDYHFSGQLAVSSLMSSYKNIKSNYYINTTHLHDRKKKINI